MICTRSQDATALSNGFKSVPREILLPTHSSPVPTTSCIIIMGKLYLGVYLAIFHAASMDVKRAIVMKTLHFSLKESQKG